MIFISILTSLPLFLSCSHADNLLEEYEIEVEHVIADTTKNSTQNDTINDNKGNTENIITTKENIKVSYGKYMKITPLYGMAQGAACYRKYFIQGYAKNAALGLYDLEKKQAICKLNIPAPAASSTTHANTINFGNERFSPDDYFPLLYVCSGYMKQINGSQCSSIYVYRICKYDNSDGSEGFHVEFVQTILLKGFDSWTDGIIDQDHNILWIKYNSNNEFRYASFTMPKLKDGDITISKEEAITDFSIGKQLFTSYHQGNIYYDKKIIFVCGTSYKTQKIALVVDNILTHTRELVIDLAEIGLTSEPENVFIYNNQLMIGYQRAIYKFNIYQ